MICTLKRPYRIGKQTYAIGAQIDLDAGTALHLAALGYISMRDVLKRRGEPRRQSGCAACGRRR